MHIDVNKTGNVAINPFVIDNNLMMGHAKIYSDNSPSFGSSENKLMI